MRSDQFSTHSRRDFIKMAGGAGIFAAASGTLNLFANNQATELTQTNRNVILFATDQQQELR